MVDKCSGGSLNSERGEGAVAYRPARGGGTRSFRICCDSPRRSRGRNEQGSLCAVSFVLKGGRISFPSQRLVVRERCPLKRSRLVAIDDHIEASASGLLRC